jgi:DNA repair protein RadC
MPPSPNKLSRFWQELKRRKIVRVITVYAAAVILALNHPSGNLNPSEADIRITERVRKALKLVEIQLLDHLILNKDERFIIIEDK